MPNTPNMPNWNRYREMLLMYHIFFAVRILGYVLCFASFLTIFLMATHSDSVSLLNLYEETWTSVTYFKGVILSLSFALMSYIFSRVSSLYCEKSIGWIKGFENHWKSYFEQQIKK